MNIGEKIAFIACAGAAVICMVAVAILVRQSNLDKQKIEELTNKIKQYESIEIPSTGELDSLKNDINYKDSIIKQIKTEYIKDVEWVKNMPDSAAVALFHQLVWANSNAD